jgi:hypothetical protein
MNSWNYDGSCILTELPVQDFENIRHLCFAAQSAHGLHINHSPLDDPSITLYPCQCCMCWKKLGYHNPNF